MIVDHSQANRVPKTINININQSINKFIKHLKPKQIMRIAEKEKRHREVNFNQK